jgi:hypothetical protein
MSTLNPLKTPSESTYSYGGNLLSPATLYVSVSANDGIEKKFMISKVKISLMVLLLMIISFLKDK